MLVTCKRSMINENECILYALLNALLLLYLVNISLEMPKECTSIFKEVITWLTRALLNAITSIRKWDFGVRWGQPGYGRVN